MDSVDKPTRVREGGAVHYGRATCESCKAEFTRRRKWQRFCSVDCRNDWHRGRAGGDRRP